MGLLTIILVAILPIESITFAMISIAPISITVFLYSVPNHHNVLTVIISAITFLLVTKDLFERLVCNDGEKTRSKYTEDFVPVKSITSGMII